MAPPPSTTMHAPLCAKPTTSIPEPSCQMGAISAADLPDGLAALAQSPDTWGRVGWRASTPDRLPLVGALPWRRDRLEPGQPGVPVRLRLDQTRMIPRARNDTGGLYVLSGLGSRGITSGRFWPVNCWRTG